MSKILKSIKNSPRYVDLNFNFFGGRFFLKFLKFFENLKKSIFGNFKIPENMFEIFARQKKSKLKSTYLGEFLMDFKNLDSYELESMLSRAQDAGTIVFYLETTPSNQSSKARFSG